MYGCIILGYYTGKLVNEDTKLGELKCGRGIDPNCWNFSIFSFFPFGPLDHTYHVVPFCPSSPFLQKVC